MTPDETFDLAAFFAELQRESDRGLALVAAALIDEKLVEALQGLMCEGRSAERLLVLPNAPLGTFSARIEACHALALIDEFEYGEISLIRKVRNEFAHAKHGLSFQGEKVGGLCASFKSDLPQGGNYPINEPRFRFINAAVTLVLRLYYRGAWVAQERRASKEWVPADQSRWRSIADEPPPVDTPVVAIGRGEGIGPGGTA